MEAAQDIAVCCNKKPLCLFLSAVVILQLGSSLSPSTMTGGTCQLVGAVAPWRSVLLFTPLSVGTADCSCRLFFCTAARFRGALLF